MPRIPLTEEDENIYIDCNPVDIIGNEVVEESDNSRSGSSTSPIIITRNMGNMNNFNLGIQFTIAIALFGIIYGLGNYVFKTVPKNMLEKRLNGL